MAKSRNEGEAIEEDENVTSMPFWKRSATKPLEKKATTVKPDVQAVQEKTTCLQTLKDIKAQIIGKEKNEAVEESIDSIKYSSGQSGSQDNVIEYLKKEAHELKAARDKQQTEFKLLYQDKQKLFEEIMILKDQVAQAKSETKEKIVSMQFIEKEKSGLQTHIDSLKQQVKTLEQELSQIQNEDR